MNKAKVMQLVIVSFNEATRAAVCSKGERTLPALRVTRMCLYSFRVKKKTTNCDKEEQRSKQVVKHACTKQSRFQKFLPTASTHAILEKLKILPTRSFGLVHEYFDLFYRD